MSILKTIPITLDLKRVGAQAQALPTLVEGDNGNVFLITMTDDGEPLDLSTASRIICVFSKTSDGKTVEQDTKDANVSLDEYGLAINEADAPVLNDKIIVINAGGNLTVNVSGSGITGATADAEKFLAKLPDNGTYEFIYNGESWQYGNHSVAIGGDDHNVVTVALRSASFGAGTNNCEVQVYSGADGEYLVTSANFNFKGRKGIMNDETLVAEDRYPILVSLIADATNAWNNARPFGQPSATLEMLDPDDDAYVNLVKDAVSVRWDFGIPKAEGAPSSDLPLPLGTADAGTSLLYSREDHVHPMPAADDIPTDSIGVSVQDALDTINAWDADDIPTDNPTISIQDSLDDKATITSVTNITELKFDTFNNLSWTSSSPHSSDTQSVYGHRCSIPCSGVTHDMFAEVVFGVDSAISGLYSPISECYDGGVYIWATEATNPTILSILVHK